jgi:hypothetical protein
MDEMGGALPQMGETRNECKILVEKHERMKEIGSPRCRWKDNIRIDLREVRWEGMD